MPKKKRKKAGSAPGSLVYTGKKKLEKLNITCLQYRVDDLKEQLWEGDPLPAPLPGYTNWYDIRGLHDVELIGKIGRQFDMHPLVAEDLLNVHQRPKIEVFEQGVFITLKALHYQEGKNEIITEHIGLYFGPGFCLSFQEDRDDLYEGVRERLLRGSGKIRSRGSDYLAYALIDETVDRYFHSLDSAEEAIEKLEEEIMVGAAFASKSDIHNLKKELLKMRRAIGPLREAIGQFSRAESPLIQIETLPFIRDVYDHLIQIIEMTESYRDMLNSLHDLYLSEISFSMNKVIQVLTIVSAFFIPLTFLAGIYGMNFKYMPELEWQYGYFALLGLMLLIILGMIWFFRRNKWL